MKLRLNQDLGLAGVWIQKTVKWVEASLKKTAARVRIKLQQKLRSLRAQRLEEVKNTRQKQSFVKKKVIKRTISNLGFRRFGKWAEASLKKSAARVRSKLQQKLRSLRAQRLEEVKNTRQKQGFVKKVVYNNSSKVLTEEQLELLALGLNFGLAPRKFPLAEYVAAKKDLCQKLEKIGDGESVEKARISRNEVFIHLKRDTKWSYEEICLRIKERYYRN